MEVTEEGARTNLKNEKQKKGGGGGTKNKPETRGSKKIKIRFFFLMSAGTNVISGVPPLTHGKRRFIRKRK